MRNEYYMWALSRRVLVVAKAKFEGDKLFDWAAYVDAVPGEDHCNEYLKVTETGSKVDEQIAIILFPKLDPNKYRR